MWWTGTSGGEYHPAGTPIRVVIMHGKLVPQVLEPTGWQNDTALGGAVTLFLCRESFDLAERELRARGLL